MLRAPIRPPRRRLRDRITWERVAEFLADVLYRADRDMSLREDPSATNANAWFSADQAIAREDERRRAANRRRRLPS